MSKNSKPAAAGTVTVKVCTTFVRYVYYRMRIRDQSILLFFLLFFFPAILFSSPLCSIFCSKLFIMLKILLNITSCRIIADASI